MNLEKLNDPKTIDFLSKKAFELSAGMDDVTFMHVCGTHEHTIVSSNLRSLFPPNVSLVAGPGCPVCITPKEDIEKMIHLAKKGLTITTFGDMFNIPTDSGSLADAKAQGADVRIVYGVGNALAIAQKEDREVVHFGIGFETTVPTSSVALINAPENFSILSVHRTIPEALEFLLENKINVNGFIDPGHVSTIIGARAYEPITRKYGVPQVIAGFEPGDVMMSIVLLLEQLHDKSYRVENEYARGVREEGNKKAIDLMEMTFKKVDAKWRALPVIPRSGLAIREAYSEHDALKRHEEKLSDFSYEPKAEESGCRCSDILLGNCMPHDCPLFRGVCTPDSPIGPCMVSVEGSCNIAFRFGPEQ